MQDNIEKISFFVKCKNALNSSFIMFESKVEDLFISTGETQIIFEIFKRCLDGYNYDYLKLRHLIEPTKELKGAFIPPERREDFIAFSLNVLHELVDKTLSFNDLIHLYFEGEDYKEKFEDFKQRFLQRLYDDVYQTVVDLFEMMTLKISDKNLENNDINDKIAVLKNSIKEEKIKLEDKEYLEYFIDAVIDGKSAEVCYTAIRYILSNYKKGEEIFKKITEALSL